MSCAECSDPLRALISLRELSRRTGLSVGEVRRLRDEEGLPVYRLGPRWQRVHVPEVLEWLRERRTVKSKPSGA